MPARTAGLPRPSLQTRHCCLGRSLPHLHHLKKVTTPLAPPATTRSDKEIGYASMHHSPANFHVQTSMAGLMCNTGLFASFSTPQQSPISVVKHHVNRGTGSTPQQHHLNRRHTGRQAQEPVPAPSGIWLARLNGVDEAGTSAAGCSCGAAALPCSMESSWLPPDKLAWGGGALAGPASGPAGGCSSMPARFCWERRMNSLMAPMPWCTYAARQDACPGS